MTKIKSSSNKRTFQALLNWMKDVITEKKIAAEWAEVEGKEQYAAPVTIGVWGDMRPR